MTITGRQRREICRQLLGRSVFVASERVEGKEKAKKGRPEAELRGCEHHQTPKNPPEPEDRLAATDC